MRRYVLVMMVRVTKVAGSWRKWYWMVLNMVNISSFLVTAGCLTSRLIASQNGSSCLSQVSVKGLGGGGYRYGEMLAVRCE